MSLTTVATIGTSAYSSVRLSGAGSVTFTLPKAAKFTCEKGPLGGSTFTSVEYDVKEVEKVISQAIEVAADEVVVCPGAPFVGATYGEADPVEVKAVTTIEYPKQGSGYTIKAFSTPAKAVDPADDKSKAEEGGVTVTLKHAAGPAVVSFDGDFGVVSTSVDAWTGCTVTSGSGDDKKTAADVACLAGEISFTAEADVQYEIALPNYTMSKRSVVDDKEKVTYAKLGGVALVVDDVTVFAQELNSASFAGVFAAGVVAVASVAALLF